MPSLPTGTVTFLLSDIEGSTRLLQHLGDRYAGVLTEHRELLRAAFQQWGGYEIDTAGDGFFVAFDRATHAVTAAVAAQRAVAARICAAGHGGQILLSRTTRDLVDHDLPLGARLQDLGDHRLKDLQRPERLFQLVLADGPVAELGNRQGTAVCLGGYAGLAVAQGRFAHAARLLGAMGALREALGVPFPAGERADYQRHMAAARASLGEAAFVAGCAAGRTMTPEQAIADYG
jgi:hypothetical protein